MGSLPYYLGSLQARSGLKPAGLFSLLPKRRRVYYLNEYETNQKYGGAEEGGWWYDTGRFIKSHGSFECHEEAQAALRGLDGYLTEARRGLYPKSSVRCTGWPEIRVDDRPGADYPNYRPVYE